MATKYDLYPIQSYYLFHSKEPDPVRSFEQLTRLRLDRRAVYTFPVSTSAQTQQNPKETKKSGWNSFWEDGWSHVTFGTVSTAFGIGILCVVTGPVGWASAVLAITGGAIGAASGVGQLVTTDAETKKLLAQVGDVSLSLNNIPGFATGITAYALTGNYEQSVNYANYAGLAAGGYGIAKGGMNIIKMQSIYTFEVGLNSTSWSRRTRNINAALMEIDPKGLEGSHLIPQRIIRQAVKQFPEFQRTIENLANGPLGIKFVTPLEHALVDSYRFRTLPLAQKEALAAAEPFRAMLLQNYPQVADTLGFIPNMSPTLRPAFNSVIITGGRGIKMKATSSSDK